VSPIDALPQPSRSNRTQVLTAIEQLPAGAWIAADADNTLWAGDVGDEIVRAAATPPHTPWQPGDASLERYFSLMDRSYADGCRFSAQLLASVDPAAARARLIQVFAARVTPRAWLITALQAAMARGVKLIVISASPLPAVQLGIELVGLQGAEAIGLEYALAPEPHFVEPIPVGFGKPAALIAQGKPRPDLALGDSRWDLPLLQHARVGCWLVPASDEV
jgi:phosphoserine phosphatase